MTPLTIRTSREEDIAAIRAIDAHHVLHGTATFETDVPAPAEMAARRANVLAKGLPHRVAEQNARVLGYAYCDLFRPRAAYRFTVENSIDLDQAAYGRSVGAQLLGMLAYAVHAAGIRRMIAIIGDSGHAASMGIHRKLGFKHTGLLKDRGWKLGRWLDAVLMDKPLGEGSASHPEARPA